MQHGEPTRALAATLAGLLMGRGDGALAAWEKPEAGFGAAPGGLGAGGAVSVDLGAGGLGAEGAASVDFVAGGPDAGGNAAAVPGGAVALSASGGIEDRIWACVKRAGEQWGGEQPDSEWKGLRYVLENVKNRERLVAFLDFDAGCAAQLAGVMHTQRGAEGLANATRRTLCELCVVLQGAGVPSVEEEKKWLGLYGAETAPRLLRRRSWELLGALLVRQCDYTVRPKRMENLGATCYLNAVVACMLSCRTFVAYLWTLQGILEENLTEYVPATLATEIGSALAGAAQCMYSAEDDTCRVPLQEGVIDMENIFETIIAELMCADIGLQQDVHECYMFMAAGRAPRQSQESPGNEIAGKPGLLSRNTMLAASVVATFVHCTEFSGCINMECNRKVIHKQAIPLNMFYWSNKYECNSYTEMIKHVRSDGDIDWCDLCKFHILERDAHLRSVGEINKTFEYFKNQQQSVIADLEASASDSDFDTELETAVLKSGIEKRDVSKKYEIEQLNNKYRLENPLKITTTDFFAFPTPAVFIIHMKRCMHEGGEEEFRRDDVFDIEEYLYVVAASDKQYYTLVADAPIPHEGKYRACGVARHNGSEATHGHYMSYVRRNSGKEATWFVVDDTQEVVGIEFTEVVVEASQNVCMVFYELETQTPVD